MYLLASDIFARVRLGELRLSDSDWRDRLYLTPLQRESLSTPNDTALSEIPVFEIAGTPAATAVVMARLAQDVATCPADGLFGLLDRAMKGRAVAASAKNEDLIVGQIAVRYDLCVVTDDVTFGRALRQCGGTVMPSAEFFSANSHSRRS